MPEAGRARSTQCYISGPGLNQTPGKIFFFNKKQINDI